MPGPSGRMGCDPKLRHPGEGRQAWSRGLCGGCGVGWLVGLSFRPTPFSQTPHPNPAGSIHATSVAASRVEQALSEVASSLQSSAPSRAPCTPG